MANYEPGVIGFAKQFFQEFNDDDLTGMSAEVAYNLLFALFPTLIFIAALAGFVGTAVGVDDLFDQIFAALGQVLPEAALEMIAGPILAVLSTRSTRAASPSAPRWRSGRRRTPPP